MQSIFTPKLRNVQTSPQSHSAIDFFFFPLYGVPKLCLNFAGVWVKNEVAQPELKMPHLLEHSATLHYFLFTRAGAVSRIRTCCLFVMAVN